MYQQCGHFAKKRGTVISVISIKGSQTKLEHLGALSDLTSGAVDLVDPNHLDFGNFLKSSVVATNCVVTAILHKDFMFRSAEPGL